jgi:hypothetical protein
MLVVPADELDVIEDHPPVRSAELREGREPGKGLR